MASQRILIVEDDDDVAHLLCRHLDRLGYTVAGTVASGEEALAQAEMLRPDLALMDITLAGAMDGVQTAIALRERFEVGVVFLTGLSDDQTIARSQEAGAFGYLVKPFRREDLKTSLELALNKQQIEHRLLQIECWFTAAIHSIGDGVITIDDQDRVTFLNPVAESLTGWSRRDATGRGLDDVFQPNPPAPAAGTGAAAPPVRESARLTARDGATHPVEYTAAPMRNEAGQVIGRVLVFRDITQRRQAEEELHQSREQLRALAAHVEKVREEERTRIAREVHDELGQMITGLRMDLSWLERRLPGVTDAGLRAALEAKMKSMSDLLDHLVKTVRKISSDLRPGALDDLGLVPAMEWQARDWQNRTGIECVVVSSLGTSPVPPEHATALFRIFQETLTNVARHAHATRVRAEVGLSNGQVTLRIQDNGRGITQEEQRQTKSFGLLGMKERAGLLGGTCQIEGRPGQGTSVQIGLPF